MAPPCASDASFIHFRTRHSGTKNVERPEQGSTVLLQKVDTAENEICLFLAYMYFDKQDV